MWFGSDKPHQLFTWCVSLYFPVPTYIVWMIAYTLHKKLLFYNLWCHCLNICTCQEWMADILRLVLTPQTLSYRNLNCDTQNRASFSLALRYEVLSSVYTTAVWLLQLMLRWLWMFLEWAVGRRRGLCCALVYMEMLFSCSASGKLHNSRCTTYQSVFFHSWWWRCRYSCHLLVSQISKNSCCWQVILQLAKTNSDHHSLYRCFPAMSSLIFLCAL